MFIFKHDVYSKSPSTISFPKSNSYCKMSQTLWNASGAAISPCQQNSSVQFLSLFFLFSFLQSFSSSSINNNKLFLSFLIFKDLFGPHPTFLQPPQSSDFSVLFPRNMSLGRSWIITWAINKKKGKAKIFW